MKPREDIDPDHVYQENEVLICAMQYPCPDENIGFRGDRGNRIRYFSSRLNKNTRIQLLHAISIAA